MSSDSLKSNSLHDAGCFGTIKVPTELYLRQSGR